MKLKYLYAGILFLITAPLSAEMYRWVDEKGEIHYSDKPPNEDAQPYAPPPILTTPPSPYGNKLPASQQSVQQTTYQHIAINTPVNGSIFTPDKADNIQVSVQITPNLDYRHRHQIILYVNGQQYAQSQQFNFNLTGLHRGAHTIQAAVVDQDGKTLKSSDSISIHIQRHHR